MHLKANPAWTFKGKSQKNKKFLTPGPGAYNPSTKSESKFSKPPNFKIGTASRDKFVVTGVPGPGTYTASFARPHSSAPVIGTSKRPPLSDTIATPGPGSYEIKPKAVEGPQFSMVGRGNNPGATSSPGPGQYEQSVNDFIGKERAPTYRIGSASRTSRQATDRIPGPGTYKTCGKGEGPKWQFGSEARTKMFKVDVPGPGTYEIPNAMSKTGYSITGRKPESVREPFPGPGAYNSVSERPKSPSWTMSKTARMNFHADDTGVPGPGSYSPKGGLSKTGVVFGSSTRRPLSGVGKTPGPGEYDFHEKKKNSPAFTMRPRTGKKKMNEVPGPGTYDPKENIGDPKYSVGKDRKGLDYGLAKSKSMPGPGFYNVSKKLGGPKWGFGTSSRDKFIPNPAPGPGHYDFYSSISNLPQYAASKAS